MAVRGRPFQPGHKLSPGRPKGSKNRKTLLREQIEQFGPELMSIIKTAVLENQDMAAAGMLLARLEPPLRPRGETVEFELDPNLPLAEQAQQVVVAISKGQIEPEVGKQLIDSISALADIRSADEFEARLQALEKRR